MNIIEIVNENPIKSAILIYLILMSILIFVKPQYVFDENGQHKEFGVGYTNKTLLPIWLICFLFAIVSYYFILIIRTVY
jgi:hypothetical protein